MTHNNTIMNTKSALISLYIKDGTSKLLQFSDSTLNKKKMKKSIVQENIDFHPSIYNFVVLKNYRPNTSNITNQEIIKNIEGKTRSMVLYNNQENLQLKDINAFKILYQKYLKSPLSNIDLGQQAQVAKNIKTKIGVHIFKPYLQNTQMEQCLQKVANQVNQVKLTANLTTKQLFKQTQKTLLQHRSERQNFQYYAQEQRKRYKMLEEFLHPPFLKEQIHCQSEQICTKIINLTIFRWFSQLLEAISFKDLLATPKMIVSWQNSLLQQEKEQLLTQQISGKILFNVQQNISHLIQTIKQLDFGKQFHLRQKKYGIHSYSNNDAIKNDKGKSNKSVEKVSIVSFQDKNKVNNGSKRLNDQPSGERSYSQIANRVNNLRRNSGKSEKIVIQPPNSQDSAYSRGQSSKQQINCNYKFIQYKKPTPLKYQQFSQFQFKQDKNEKHQPTNNRLLLRNAIPAQKNQAKNAVSKVQVKFPIKIQHFQMNSWTQSFICYKSQQINLKQLPFTFMKDRHKFGQNRVKIEYPCRPQTNIAQVVYKSMQILNCFGAEVYCEQQASYKSVNEIDEAEILAVSWVIERPVREVIKLYGQFYGGCATKK